MPVRSFHFIPAHKPQLFERLDRLGADRYVFDLEDAVPTAEKSAARGFLEEFLRSGSPGHHYVRIHEPGHPEHEHDIKLVRRLPIVGIVVPKFSGAASLDELERGIGVADRSVVLMVESFSSANQLDRALEGRSWRPYAVGLGFEDMLTSVPHSAGDLVHLLRHIRTTLAVCCRARGLLAIDGISGTEITEAEFERHCLESRSCGLHGKFSIHPRQVAPINRVFGLDPALIRWAERISGLTGLRGDCGYERIGDEVVTPPKIKKARYLLNLGHSQPPPL